MEAKLETTIEDLKDWHKKELECLRNNVIRLRKDERDLLRFCEYNRQLQKINKELQKYL